MKKLIIFVLLVFVNSNSSFGINNLKCNGNVIHLEVYDTIPILNIESSFLYRNDRLAVIIPGAKKGEQIQAEQVLETIDPAVVSSVEVHDKMTKTLIGDFEGSVFLKFKDGYTPDLMSIKELGERHEKIFIYKSAVKLNGIYLGRPYSNYVLDFNNVQEVEIDRIKDEKKLENVLLINIITKSNSGLKKVNEGFEIKPE